MFALPKLSLTLPKIEKITRDAALSHFFLMFGFKLFSLYFPLFLVTRGFSLSQVGYTYLLIYLPIVFFSPFVGFLNHKINPAVLSAVGILGYAAYALGMIFVPGGQPQPLAFFYFLQVLLGLSAALFFVSSKNILMASPLENYDRAFGWFYTANFYADAISPAIGALFIWKFGFISVFALSVVLHIFNAIFCLVRLKSRTRGLKDSAKIQESLRNYKAVFQKIKTRALLFPLLAALSVLFVGGFYHAFFFLFLKDVFGWSQDIILIYGSVYSFLFLPVSLYIISRVSRQKSEKNIFQGSVIYGLFSIILGALTPLLNFSSMLLLSLGKDFGGLTAASGRSGIVSQKLNENPEEAGAIDTIFPPLGTALGALVAGTVIGYLGYQNLFILGGIFVLIVALLGYKLMVANSKNLS